MGLVDYKPENVIKILEGDKAHEFNYKIKKGQSVKYIYNIVMLLSDDQLKKKNAEPVNIYLTTNDGEQHVFSDWEILPEHNQIKQWGNVKAKDLKAFEKKLKAISSPKNKVKFVVQLVKTQKGDHFFKLIDTVFLNF